MDANKVELLASYAFESSETASKSDVVNLLNMYLGDAAEDVPTSQSMISAAVDSLFKSESSLSLDEIKASCSSGHLADAAASVLEKAPAKISDGTSNLQSVLDGNFDDDDDDDAEIDDDDDDDEDLEELPDVTMRGYLKPKDSKLNWTGKWQLSNDKSVSDKFKYSCDAPSYPPDGRVALKGAFLMTENQEQVKVLDEMELEFSNDGKVSGTGSNVKGSFTVAGELQRDSHKLALVRQYEARSVKRARAA